MVNKPQNHGRERPQTRRAASLLKKTMELKDELKGELDKTETLPEYEEMIGLLHELEGLEEEARNNLKTNLRNNK